MNYKESITEAMTALARDPSVCFVGYGIRHGRAMGTLKNVSDDQLIETPIAENLMIGLAIGLSLRGKKPVVFIERADFLMNAMDAIVNHLAKIEMMSRGQFKPAIILRVIVGNKTKELFTGETHTQDFAEAFEAMVSERTKMRMLVTKLYKEHAEAIAAVYHVAHANLELGRSSAFWEYKDFY